MSSTIIVKRDGRHECADKQKIANRMQTGSSLPGATIEQLIEKIWTSLPSSSIPAADVCRLIARTAASMPSTLPIANHVERTRLEKDIGRRSLVEVWRLLVEENTLDEALLPFVVQHQVILQKAVDTASEDAEWTFFGLMTLQKSYLLRTRAEQIVETPSLLFMRVSIALHAPRLDKVLDTFRLLTRRQCMHATPTLFNAGTRRPQLSSCFLTNIKADSIEGIFETLKDCAEISRHSGGIGLSISNVRASNSIIRGTQGKSNGLIPMLRVFNATARYVDQGGRRPGSIAVYLEPWHADIEAFLEARLPGKSDGTVDLFYGLWIPDRFMCAVRDDADWSLFCPNEAPGLDDCWGEEFEALYNQYVHEGRMRRTIKARELWMQILNSQCETGLPYILHKDNVNRASPQQHLGVIKCSNLCTEITLYTKPGEETAVCNLASLCLPQYVTPQGIIDYRHLGAVVEVLVDNLNQVIDRNLYPTNESRVSNFLHRPIGIGVQGLSDVFMRLGLPFESREAVALDRRIFECIYYHALRKSCALAKEHGPHESFPGSPASKGLLQYDLWGETETVEKIQHYDWRALKEEIRTHGLRNACLIAPMPTASTSQIAGSVCEGIEPLTSNLYTRHTMSGNFVCSNPILIQTLTKLGLWNDAMERELIRHKGSVQAIDRIPEAVRTVFKTCFEMKQRWVIDHAKARGVFVDQSMSMNLYFTEPSVSLLSSCHLYGWKNGLKTGMYYLRQKAASESAAFSMEEEVCESCGS